MGNCHCVLGISAICVPVYERGTLSDNLDVLFLALPVFAALKPVAAAREVLRISFLPYSGWLIIALYNEAKPAYGALGCTIAGFPGVLPEAEPGAQSHCEAKEFARQCYVFTIVISIRLT